MTCRCRSTNNARRCRIRRRRHRILRGRTPRRLLPDFRSLPAIRREAHRIILLQEAHPPEDRDRVRRRDLARHLPVVKINRIQEHRRLDPVEDRLGRRLAAAKRRLDPVEDRLGRRLAPDRRRLAPEQRRLAPDLRRLAPDLRRLAPPPVGPAEPTPITTDRGNWRRISV